MAIGVGANASFLNLELKVKQPQSVKISVFNISNEAGIFRVYPDELSDWIKISPNNFRLEAGESREVEISVFAKKMGIRATNISVLSEPLGRQSFSVGSGIKIPLRLNVSYDKSYLLASVFSALNSAAFSLFAGILSVFFFAILAAKYFFAKKIKK